MKTPRVNDFDPDAKVPTLKSSLDNMPSIQKFTPIAKNTSSIPSVTLPREKSDATPQTLIRDVHPVRPVLPVPPKRTMKQRWPVDIYQDQYESLHTLALEERMQGGIGSMSAMVREALDKLINERKAKR